jgi:hypothetical protein
MSFFYFGGGGAGAFWSACLSGAAYLIWMLCWS